MKVIKGGVGAVSWNSQQVKLLTPPPHPPLSLARSHSRSLAVYSLSFEQTVRAGGRKNRETELCFCLPLTRLVQWQPETGYPDGVWFPNWLAGLSLLLGFVLRFFPTPLWNYHCRDIPSVNVRVWCAMPMPGNLVVSDWGRPWRGATTTGAAPATTFFGKSWQSAAAVMPGSEVSDFNTVMVDFITEMKD